MLDEKGEIIYIGKAKNLRRRLSSYFRTQGLAPKTVALVRQIATIEVIITHTDGEALLLENTLIKQHLPRYNILLRDDKSYPYLFISDHLFPRLSSHRGAKRQRGKYFGPYPSAGAVRDSLILLQKLFPVRQCEESVFRNRSRPCLQHQIGRCSAPCTHEITVEAYADEVRHTELFLQGKESQVIDELAQRMESAATQQHYEVAARLRDQIAHLRRVQERQHVVGEGGDFDVMVAEVQAGGSCIEVLLVRGGRVSGSKSLFPIHASGAECSELLTAALGQYYLDRGDGPQWIPATILISTAIEEEESMQQVLTQQAGRQVRIMRPQRGDRLRWMEMAHRNARQALLTYINRREHLQAGVQALQQIFKLPVLLQRIECFDISHTSGAQTVASCVVFGQEGARKAEYRRYNIHDITPGDDYAAMRQALERRFRPQEGTTELPNLLLIDGGKGQLTQAVEILTGYGLLHSMTVVGVAKGEGRKPGLEQLVLFGRSQPIILPDDSAALHLIQQVRDEAHRFAITGHRQRRSKQQKSSPLEEIPGLGPKRRQLLLRQFGGLQEVARAGIEDLMRLKGISRSLAERIYDTFHPTQ